MPQPLPTASVSSLADLQAKWRQRAAQAKAQGFSTAPIEALYKQDWAKVYAGGSAMTAEEAQASVDAAYTGAGPVTKGRKHGLLGTLENIPADLGGILWNAPRGAVETVAHLPSEVHNTLSYFANTLGRSHDDMNNWLAAHGYEQAHGGQFSQIAEALRNLSKAPLTRLVPGVSTAAALTTPQGRSSLQEHPVGTLLDVLPFVQGAAEAGLFGSGSATAIDAGKVAGQIETLQRTGRIDLADKLAQSRGFDNASDLMSHLPTGARQAEALAAGRPIKAGIRAIPALDEARLSLLQRFNATPLATGFRRYTAERLSATSRELATYGKEEVKPLAEHAKEMAKELKTTTDEQIHRLAVLAGRPDTWPSAIPSDQAWLDSLRTHQDAKAESDFLQTDHLYRTTEAGQTVYYGGEQATLLSKMQSRLDDRTGVADRARGRVEQLTNDLEDATTNLKAAQKMYTGTLRRGRSLMGAVHPTTEMLGQAALGATESTFVNRAVRAAHARVNDLQRQLDKAKVDSANAADKLDKSHRMLMLQIRRTVPARFVPLVEDQLRQKVMLDLSGQMGKDTEEFTRAMAAYDRGTSLAAYIPEKTLAKYTMEARTAWQDLAQHYNPIWLPAMDSESLDRALHPIRYRDRPQTPGIWKARYVGTTTGSTDYVLALGLAESQRLAARDHQMVVDNFIRPLARTTSQIDQELDGLYANERKRTGVTTPDAQVQNRIRTSAYTRLDANLGLGTEPKMQRLYKEDMWIPKDVAEAVASSMRGAPESELRRANLATVRLYKIAVMGLSPTHQAHIWLGMMLPMMLRAGREEFNPSRLLQSFHMARTGQLPEGMDRSLAYTSADEMMDYAHGLTMGRLLKKVTNVTDFTRHLSEMGANMYRSWAYLSEEARQLRTISDKDIAAANAVAYANKVFIDVNNLTPIEQTVAKSVFPFYSYTRWALQYVMQYPVDHPIRASILANLGEQEQAYNQAHGIPNTLSMLFMLGKPNSSGDQWGVQLRAFNPFRDTATNFTLAGIFRNLAPIPKAVVGTAGVNTLSGTPDPYPGLDIDPNTGGLIGTTKGGSPLAAAEAIVPQVGILDHYLQLSQQARSLARSDPAAYRRQVFSILNAPFVPQQYTPQLAAATHARDQIRVAQQAVSSALKSQNLNALDIYENIPVPAKLKPYLNNLSFVPLPEFKRVVEAIWQRERQTGVKII